LLCALSFIYSSLYYVAVALPVLKNNNQSAKIATQAIQHIVVIYLENHSFNNLYGLFPNANGLEQANSAAP
jgi:phospholipase C